jgi:ribosome-associated translation inhibitor RaiA
MNVEYTGRHYVVTPPIRKAVEAGLGKIRKILGDKFETMRLWSTSRPKP